MAGSRADGKRQIFVQRYCSSTTTTTTAAAASSSADPMAKSDDPYKEGYLWFPPHGVLSQLKVVTDHSIHLCCRRPHSTRLIPTVQTVHNCYPKLLPTHLGSVAFSSSSLVLLILLCTQFSVFKKLFDHNLIKLISLKKLIFLHDYI